MQQRAHLRFLLSDRGFWQPPASPCRSPSVSVLALLSAIWPPAPRSVPHGLQLLGSGEDVLHVAELGVVLLLFVIGLELDPRKLWRMKRDIFGLGTAQVVLTGACLSRSPDWSECLSQRHLSPGSGSRCRRPHLPFRSFRNADSCRHPTDSVPSVFYCCRTSPSCRCWRWLRSWRRAKARPRLRK